MQCGPLGRLAHLAGGWSPYRDDNRVHRDCGFFLISNTGISFEYNEAKMLRAHDHIPTEFSPLRILDLLRRYKGTSNDRHWVLDEESRHYHKHTGLNLDGASRRVSRPRSLLHLPDDGFLCFELLRNERAVPKTATLPNRELSECTAAQS